MRIEIRLLPTSRQPIISEERMMKKSLDKLSSS
jgi:hypothetical protein